MRVLPILFNTEMVQAILDDRKTSTRRIVKFLGGKNPNWSGYIKDGLMLYNGRNETCCRKPKYKVGDILYVRETWCWCPCWDCGMDTEDHNCCDVTANKFYNHDRGEYGCYGYKASFPEKGCPEGIWRPSIHMPKAAARIWLRVTDVRVERIQDISGGDLLKEGVEKSLLFNGNVRNAFDKFKDIWNSTIDKKELGVYGWDANPWVRVIEFERCEKPEEVL